MSVCRFPLILKFLGEGSCAYFHPIANPHEGSRNLVAQEEKEPAIGKMTASSPRAWHVQYNMAPMMEKARSSDAGPPAASALPDATNNPVPKAQGSEDGFLGAETTGNDLPHSAKCNFC